MAPFFIRREVRIKRQVRNREERGGGVSYLTFVPLRDLRNYALTKMPLS